MKFLHFMPHVNRKDLTLRALASTADAFKGHTMLIDNSPNFDFKEDSEDLHVIRPPVPLTTAQTMNYMRAIAIQNDCDVCFFQHNDAIAHAGTAKELLALATEYIENDRQWGAIFTLYDTLCAFNVSALKEVGEWDWLRFPYYFLDNDYYHRMRLAGFELIESGLPVEHIASSTLYSDPVRQAMNAEIFPACERLYQQKWGVSP